MLSYTGRRNLFGDLAGSETAEILAFGDTLIDLDEQEVIGARDWTFLEKQFTVLTDSTSQFVTLPQYVDGVDSVYVTVAGTRHSVRICPSREEWDRINVLSETSDTPEWAIVYDGKVGLFPKPATSSNVITINAVNIPKRSTIADYTTGGVLTAVVGSRTIVGTGTAWAASMAGRWLCITESDTANKGDGYYYQILSVESTTSMTLVRAYAGTAITAGNAAYAIGQHSLIPGKFQHIPVFGALQTYFTSEKPDAVRAKQYGNKKKELFSEMEVKYAKTRTVSRDDGVNCIINDNGFNL